MGGREVQTDQHWGRQRGNCRGVIREFVETGFQIRATVHCTFFLMMRGRGSFVVLTTGEKRTQGRQVFELTMQGGGHPDRQQDHCDGLADAFHSEHIN